MSEITVTAIDHLYVSVSDLDASERFYDGLMRVLGFKKGTIAIAGVRHCHYFNQYTQYSIRPARDGVGAHDPYAPGLHHLCFRVETRADVDRVAVALVGLGVLASPPRLYPEYAPDYYATFFEDLDGIRLEVVAMRNMRRLLQQRWGELEEFEDPLSKAGLV